MIDLHRAPKEPAGPTGPAGPATPEGSGPTGATGQPGAGRPQRTSTHQALLRVLRRANEPATSEYDDGYRQGLRDAVRTLADSQAIDYAVLVDQAQQPEDPADPPATRRIPGLLHTWPKGHAVPPGMLRAEGQLLAQADYPDLFAVVGRVYSQPDDPADQFRLPDMRGASHDMLVDALP